MKLSTMSLAGGVLSIMLLAATAPHFDPTDASSSHRNVAVGNQVPAFEVELIGEDRVVTDADLLGQYYLLSFWSTGCPPCIREIPNLERAHAAYSHTGFTILSLSVSQSASHVMQFREEHAEMPWLHAVVAGDTELLERFGFRGTPHLILVSPEGKILATSRELVGEALGSTLAAHLAKE